MVFFEEIRGNINALAHPTAVFRNPKTLWADKPSNRRTKGTHRTKGTRSQAAENIQC